LKITFTLFCLVSIINASTYLAKIEPYDFYQIKSSLSGIVTFVNKQSEFSFIKQKLLLIHLDTKHEDIFLENLEHSLKVQMEIQNIHQQNFKKKSKVKHISEYEKSQEKLLLLNSKQTLLNIKKDIKKSTYQKDKKTFFVENLYLNEIFVNKSEFVDVGDLLYELYDISKIKLTLFMKAEDMSLLKNTTLYVNNIKNDFTIEKVAKVRDMKRVSTYKVILIKSNFDRKNIEFGQIVTVEFK